MDPSITAFARGAAAPGATLKGLSDALGDAPLETVIEVFGCPFLVGVPAEVFDRPADAGEVPEPLRRLSALRHHRERDACPIHPLFGLREGGMGEALIGRAGGNAHVQVAHETISRRHCRLQRADGGGLEVFELGSSNGTAVEGRKLSTVSPISIRAGMRLTIGTWESLLLGPKAVYSLLRDAEWDEEAPLFDLAGFPVPADGVALRELVPHLAAVSRQKLADSCPYAFLLEVPTERGEETAFASRAKTRRLSRSALDGARRAKQAGRARVHVLAPREAGRTTVLIGRDPARCDVVIADPSVSSVHLEVCDVGDRWSLQDRRSENGTYLRGERIPSGDVAFADVRDPVWLGAYRTLILDASNLHKLASKLAGGGERVSR